MLELKIQIIEFMEKKELFNPLASPGEEVSVFTSLYLSAGAPTLGEVKGLIMLIKKMI